MDGQSKLAGKIRDARNPLAFRMARVVSYQGGLPRTCTVTLGGSTVAGVVLADHVANPAADDGVWLVAMGGGRLLILAAVTGFFE